MVLGAVLLLTAIFTISSVIRLTAYLYRDEIAVMRLVGATEFYIRGPFYVEGLFQGLAGGLLAVGSLFGIHRLVVGGGAGSPYAGSPDAGSPLLASVLAEDFLSPRQVVLLISLGALAGLVGAVTSLRREELGAPTAEDEGAEEAWEGG
jgi:cell division transport system permease protein